MILRTIAMALAIVITLIAVSVVAIVACGLVATLILNF